MVNTGSSPKQPLPVGSTTTTTTQPAAPPVTALPVASGCAVRLLVGGGPVCSPRMGEGDVLGYGFDVVAGERFTLGAYDSSTTPGSVKVYRPNGSEHSSGSFYSSDRYLRFAIDPDATGTWTVKFTSRSGESAAGSYKLELASVSSQSISPSNTTVSSPALAMGGLAVYTFSATQGTRLTIGAYKNGGGSDHIRVYRPNGSQYDYDSLGQYSSYGRVSILPDVSGTWRLELHNDDGESPSWQEAAGAFTFDLATVSTQSISPGNTTISSPALRMGGLAVYTFTATQGERLTVDASKNGGGNDLIWVYRPDGSEYDRETFFSFDPNARVSITADVTGTWVIYLGNVDGASPSWQEAAGAFTFTLRPT